MFLKEIVGLFLEDIKEFFSLDLQTVKFESPRTALGIGIFLATIVLFKLIFGRNRDMRHHSGFYIAQKLKESRLRRWLYGSAKVIAGVGIFLLLITLARPYLNESKKLTYVESRERVDAIDLSLSMTEEYQRSRKSAAEIVRSAHLNFLEMRRGKNDRVSLWGFSSHPYKFEDFIVDDDLYFFEVYDAPLAIIDDSYASNYGLHGMDEGGDTSMIAPRNKIAFIGGEGSTNLAALLRSVIEYFDKEGRKGITHKAVLIMTDAGVDQYPQAELEQLPKKGIVPYILFIEPNAEGHDRAERLITNISLYGGKYFRVMDEESLSRVFKEIDKLEKTRVEKPEFTRKKRIFYIPLSMGLSLLFASIIAGLIAEIDLGKNP